MDDRHTEARRISDASGRPDTDRDESVNPSSPSGVAAIRAIALAIFEAGYDGRDPDAMHALAADLRAAREEREAERAKIAARKGWMVVGITMVGTGAIGVFFQWLTHFLGSHTSHGPPPGGP